MLQNLRQERDRLDEAIVVLTRLASGSGVKRRGRPPKWLTANSTSTAMVTDSATGSAKPKRKPFSAATRKKMAAAQRKRWALRKAVA